MIVRGSSRSETTRHRGRQEFVAGYRRAANILRAEEKKDGAGASGGRRSGAARAAGEKDLGRVLAAAGVAAREAWPRGFEGAIRALAALRAPIDTFFLDITVNANEPVCA